MVINAVCPNCKRVYPLDDQYAGQTFSCETCGSPFTVPTPGVIQAIPTVPAYRTVGTMSYASAEISQSRLMAGRICIVLSALMYLGFAIFCCGGIALFAVPAAGPAKIVAVALIVAALVVGSIATTYLLCGLNIRKGGHISVIVALVLASLHCLTILFLTFGGVVRQFMAPGGAGAMPGGQFAISFVVQVIFLLAIGQLIYYLVKILREPRAVF